MSLLVFQVPEEMQDKEFAVILQDEPQQPLALLPLTEEEQVRHTAYVTGEARRVHFCKL